MKLERRSSFGWGATPAGHANIRNGLVAHYDGSNQGLAGKPHSACRTYWINTRRFHINTRGWLDIGYSFGVCPHGIVLEGRGLNRVQAAQPGGNSTWYSCTFMSGPSERPTAAQIQAWRELRSWLRGEYGVAAAVKGHRDFISTSCPGTIIYGMVRDGTLTKPPSSEPPEPPEEDETLKILTSLGTGGTFAVQPGQRHDVPFTREFEDPGGLHGSTANIWPKDNAFYHINLGIRVKGLPVGQHVKLVWAQHEKDGKFVRDMFGESKPGVNGSAEYQLTAVENLSKDRIYRAALINNSQAQVTVEAAYLKIAR